MRCFKDQFRILAVSSFYNSPALFHIRDSAVWHWLNTDDVFACSVAKNAGAPITAATSIPSVCGRDIPKQLTTEEVYELIKGYGEAARRAMEAGADAVEIHMAHGYLVSTFLSPRTNKRVDEFGGCFENRMRFSRLIIEEVKKATQP